MGIGTGFSRETGVSTAAVSLGTTGSAKPGLSKPRLERMHEVLSGHIERKEMPGLVALLSHNDDVHVETLGTFAFASPAPMKRDTLFRIASITKVVVAAAAMILVEECELRLGDSIEHWIPELAHRRVLKSIASQLRAEAGWCQRLMIILRSAG